MTEKGIIKPSFMPTGLMLADGTTKPLSGRAHRLFCEGILSYNTSEMKRLHLEYIASGLEQYFLTYAPQHQDGDTAP